MIKVRKVPGYPHEWEVRQRNRQYSNQPGALAQPEQAMVRDFEPSDPVADHMRGIIDTLRQPAQGYDMDYRQSNQPLQEDT